MAQQPSPGLIAPAAVALVLALVPALGSPPAPAAVMGGARSMPYGEAVAKSEQAAHAVLARKGRESCLIGKLTNAMLGLSSSCEAAGERTPLCALADRAAATSHWTMQFTTQTAQEILQLTAPGKAIPPVSVAPPVEETPTP